MVDGSVSFAAEAALREEARAKVALLAILSPAALVRVVKVPAHRNTDWIPICWHCAQGTVAEVVRDRALRTIVSLGVLALSLASLLAA